MLELVEVSKKFGDTLAVDRLSLTVGAGEFFALLGPNAAGKTTTVKMIAGLLRPNSGRIRIAGSDIVRDGTRAKSALGYVPDIPFLYDKLTAEETLDFAAAVYGMGDAEGKRAKEEMLLRFDLLRERSMLTEELSHGLRQRLVFAVAMIHKPRLMLVDEPFVGLDPRSTRSVKDALKGCAREGGAVLMCTHTLPAAEELADRIGIISHGRLVALGTFNEIKKAEGREGSLEEIFLKVTASSS
ncbi:MAG: ABC transporter ATP-binding protein [Candidatus Aureabacteria bacterium]|nr:ABC transporter ATP-binding protein [Candidatus Auribacterota bacterium]